jgi:hypothetical protein
MSTPLVTTQRINGLSGKITLGTTGTGTDIYAGGDLTDWTVDIQTDTHDASAKSDQWKVHQLGQQSWTATCKKFVAATHEVMIQIAAGTPCYIQLFQGAVAGTPGAAGAVVVAGVVILKSVRHQSPTGMEMVDVTFQGSGAPTVPLT